MKENKDIDPLTSIREELEGMFSLLDLQEDNGIINSIISVLIQEEKDIEKILVKVKIVSSLYLKNILLHGYAKESIQKSLILSIHHLLYSNIDDIETEKEEIERKIKERKEEESLVLS